MGNLKHYQLVAAALAILSVALLAPSYADRADAGDIMRYVGTTAPQTFSGHQGYFAPHRFCAAKFEEAVWCTTEMIRDGGPHLLAADPPEEGAWLQAAPQGISLSPIADIPREVIDASGLQLFNKDRFDVTNCGGAWDNVGTLNKGLVLRTNPTAAGPRVEINNETCTRSFPDFKSLDIPAACCSTVPPLLRVLPRTEPPRGAPR